MQRLGLDEQKEQLQQQLQQQVHAIDRRFVRSMVRSFTGVSLSRKLPQRAQRTRSRRRDATIRARRARRPRSPPFAPVRRSHPSMLVVVLESCGVCVRVVDDVHQLRARIVQLESELAREKQLRIEAEMKLAQFVK